MKHLTIDTSNEYYLQCIEVASWFIEVQTDFLPKVYVPNEIYTKYLQGLTAINSSRAPIFKVAPYDGTVIIAVPDLD